MKIKCTNAVILAGGKGTRLMPLTSNIPKPMVLVGGKPFLFWQLRYLKEQGIQNVLLLVSHLAEVIEQHFTQNPIAGLNITFSREPSPMGTGGAVKHAEKQLPEQFWLLNGDSFLYIDLLSMERQHESSGAEGTVAVAKPEVVPVPPNLICSDGMVVKYQKDGGAEFSEVDAGVYLLSRKIVLDGPSGTFDLGALWPAVIGRKKLGGFVVWDRFFDIGTPERLQTFEKHLKDYF